MDWPLTTVPDECNAWVRLTLNAPQSIAPPVLPGLMFFNRDHNGKPVIRKASAHGLGDVELPTDYKPRYEHTAAPFIKDKDGNVVRDKDGNPTRNYRKIVAGEAGVLFLDIWAEAILERRGNLGGIDNIICKWPELAAPQHSQTTLSTRDAWMKYAKLPNRRAFQFFITLPAPKINYKGDLVEDGPMFAELKEAEGSSLYTPFSKPFKLDLDNVYRRDTNELIKPFLECGMELQTVADRVRGYFAHTEAKSLGTVGLLERKSVIGLSKAWIGKESHPYADTVNDNPDDETLEQYKSGVAIVGGEFNYALVVKAVMKVGIAGLAKAARINKKVLRGMVVNRKDLRDDLKARLFKAISVDDDGCINVEKVPMSKKETDVMRVRDMIVKHKKIRLLGQFIHAAKATSDRSEHLKDAEVATVVAAPPGGNWNGRDATHEKIFQDLDRVCALCPPVFLSLAEIEHHARDFYGIEKGLKKKADRKVRQTEFFKSTVAKKQARRDEGRDKARKQEINRVAGVWNLPEIATAKNVKAVHTLDKTLSKIAGKGFKTKAIIYSTCLERKPPPKHI
jgi:hypothetical protein